MKKHFTSTCIVLENDQVLLIFHKKLQKWLPPGGHIEPNETPPDAVRREVLEETGLEVKLFSQENIVISRRTAKSFERPYLCQLFEVPAFGSEPAHQHMDLLYLAYPVGGSLLLNDKETDDIRWFTKEAILALQADVEIFQETQEIVCHILSSELVPR